MINKWRGELHVLCHKVWRFFIGLDMYPNWGVCQGQDLSPGRVTLTK